MGGPATRLCGLTRRRLGALRSPPAFSRKEGNAAAADAVVECARGCGWKLRVATLSALPTDARDQLFRFHDQWHNGR